MLTKKDLIKRYGDKTLNDLKRKVAKMRKMKDWRKVKVHRYTGKLKLRLHLCK